MKGEEKRTSPMRLMRLAACQPHWPAVPALPAMRSGTGVLAMSGVSANHCRQAAGAASSRSSFQRVNGPSGSCSMSGAQGFQCRGSPGRVDRSGLRSHAVMCDGGGRRASRACSQPPWVLLPAHQPRPAAQASAASAAPTARRWRWRWRLSGACRVRKKGRLRRGAGSAGGEAGGWAMAPVCRVHGQRGQRTKAWRLQAQGNEYYYFDSYQRLLDKRWSHFLLSFRVHQYSQNMRCSSCVLAPLVRASMVRMRAFSGRMSCATTQSYLSSGCSALRSTKP